MKDQAVLILLPPHNIVPEHSTACNTFRIYRSPTHYGYRAESDCPCGIQPVSYTHLDVYKRQFPLFPLWSPVSITAGARKP